MSVKHMKKAQRSGNPLSLEKYVKAAVRLNTGSPLEVCDLPPEAEALRHIVDVTEDDFDALSISTS